MIRSKWLSGMFAFALVAFAVGCGANPQTNPPKRPTISSLTATSTPPAMLSTSTVTISLSSPSVVNKGDVLGLGFEFDIRKSLAVDMQGQITGVVNSFTMQGPHGRLR